MDALTPHWNRPPPYDPSVRTGSCGDTTVEVKERHLWVDDDPLFVDRDSGLLIHKRRDLDMCL